LPTRGYGATSEDRPDEESRKRIIPITSGTVDARSNPLQHEQRLRLAGAQLSCSNRPRVANSYTMTHWNLYLPSKDSSKQWVLDRLDALLESDSLVPAFPEAALKLCNIAKNENTQIDDVARVVAVDAGLTARCIHVASSIGFAARPIESIDQALVLIGMEQVRRIAIAVAAIDTFSNFSDQIDWRRYWLHNILVGRLTERVAATFRKTTGREYLSGLLHDIGKLIIEHYFPEQSQQITALAAERSCGHAAVEIEVLGVNHAQIGAALCECMRVHPHILKAVWYHHDPQSVEHTADPNGDGGFLASCIAIGDRLAHRANIGVIDRQESGSIVEDSAEWLFLQRLAVPDKVEIDLKEEVRRTDEDLKAFLA
jgi:putative nucleotidyltransferase with HDIG domain